MLIQNLYFIRRIESFLQEGGNTVINKYKISIPEIGQEDYIIIEETKNYNRKNYLLNTKDNDTLCLLMFKENDHMYIESLNSFDNCLTIKGKKINGSFLALLSGKNKIPFTLLLSLAVAENPFTTTF